MSATPSPAAVSRARAAVMVIFAIAGIVFASWASRVADTKTALALTPGQLGVTLLGMSIGSVIGLPLAGRLVARYGTTRVIAVAAIIGMVGFAGAGIVVDARGSRWVLMGVGALFGATVGVWDVAMNLEGTAVESALGRAIMPHFHAAFSGGTVVGALIGVAASWGHVPLSLHFGAAALAALAGVFWALPRFISAEPVIEEIDRETRAGSAWLEPRTLAIGIVVFAAAFTEGTANDWLAVAMVDGYDLPNWTGTLAFATFLSAMTATRILGTAALDRFGRVPVLRVSAILAIAGSMLVVFGGERLAFLGAATWGAGAALAFPVGMSASADDPRRAAARMSTVATIGYVAFIAGPPLLGFLGDRFGVLRSLLVVTALSIVALAAIDAVREPARP